MEDFDGRIIILILFVVISGVKWLLEKIKNQGQEHDVNESLEEIYDDFRDEIRRRQTTVQPPAPAPTHNAPAAPVPPPLPGAQVPQPRPPAPAALVEEPPAPQLFQTKKPELTEAQKAAAERFEQLGQKKRVRTHATGPISARALLSNPQSARQAVILHEVFGKPKSMQEV